MLRYLSLAFMWVSGFLVGWWASYQANKNKMGHCGINE